MRYVCIHDLDDYVRAVLRDVCQDPDLRGVRVVRFLPSPGRGNSVVCELDAPSEEAFLCWLTRVNAHCKRECCHPVPGPEEFDQDSKTESISQRRWTMAEQSATQKKQPKQPKKPSSKAS